MWPRRRKARPLRSLSRREATGDRPRSIGGKANAPRRVISIRRLRLKPGETVEVALPPLEGSAGPFASRTYAIRIRARQLR
jgi:hypothetical protein